jgi:hypothetical protein
MVPAYLELLRRKMALEAQAPSYGEDLGRQPAGEAALGVTAPSQSYGELGRDPAALALPAGGEDFVTQAQGKGLEGESSLKQDTVLKEDTSPALRDPQRALPGHREINKFVGELPGMRELEDSIKEDRDYARELGKMKPGIDLAPAIGLFAAQWGGFQGSSLPDVYKAAKSGNALTPEKMAMLKKAVLSNATENSIKLMNLKREYERDIKSEGTSTLTQTMAEAIRLASKPVDPKVQGDNRKEEAEEREKLLKRFNTNTELDRKAMEAAGTILTQPSSKLELPAIRNYIVKSVLGDTGPMNKEQENTSVDESLPGQWKQLWASIVSGKLDAGARALVIEFAKDDYKRRLSKLHDEAGNILSDTGRYNLRNPKQLLESEIKRYESTLKKIPITTKEKIDKRMEEKKKIGTVK